MFQAIGDILLQKVQSQHDKSTGNKQKTKVRAKGRFNMESGLFFSVTVGIGEPTHQERKW